MNTWLLGIVAGAIMGVIGQISYLLVVKPGLSWSKRLYIAEGLIDIAILVCLPIFWDWHAFWGFAITKTVLAIIVGIVYYRHEISKIIVK